MRCARRHKRDQVSDVDHPRRVIEGIVVDHEARMRRHFEYFDELAKRNVLLDRDDIGARYHDSFNSGFPQSENVLEHRRFFGRKIR